MQPYKTDVKTKIVKLYLETKSIVSTQRRFRRHFKTRKAPSRTVILSLSEVSGTWECSELKKGRCGRKKTKRTPANAERIREALQRNPKKSMRRLCQELRCSKSTAHRPAGASDLSARHLSESHLSELFSAHVTSAIRLLSDCRMQRVSM